MEPFCWRFDRIIPEFGCPSARTVAAGADRSRSGTIFRKLAARKSASRMPIDRRGPGRARKTRASTL
jgi:hypothetical protein